MFIGVDAFNHWRDDRDGELILDYGYDKGLCHAALAEALEIEGEYNVELMQDAFAELPEDKPNLTFAQRQLLESYITAHPALQTGFDIWWEVRYGQFREEAI